jgi:hypothetical protein
MIKYALTSFVSSRATCLFQFLYATFLCRSQVDLWSALAFQRANFGGLTLLAPCGQMRRVNAFTTQQGADIARRRTLVGSNKNAQFLDTGKHGPLGSGNGFRIGTQHVGGRPVASWGAAELLIRCFRLCMSGTYRCTLI